MKEKSKKNNPLKSMITSWKKMDPEKRTLIIIIVIVILFIMFMPSLYKGWVNLRDHGFRIGSNNKEKVLTMTCTQSVKDNDYKTDIKTVISYQNNQLKKEDYTMVMEAISDNGKKELPARRELYTNTEEIYKKYKGFGIKTNYKDHKFTYQLTTNYEKIEKDKIKKDSEADELSSITVDLELNQNIDEVKSYYENLGLTCNK